MKFLQLHTRFSHLQHFVLHRTMQAQHKQDDPRKAADTPTLRRPTMRKFVVSAVTVLGLAAATAPATAEDVTVSVKYSDLNLTSAEGVQTLEARIAAAVKTVCERPETSRELKSMQAWDSCKSAATAKARAQLEKTVDLASL
jgi:UrcA family protein